LAERKKGGGGDQIGINYLYLTSIEFKEDQRELLSNKKEEEKHRLTCYDFSALVRMKKTLFSGFDSVKRNGKTGISVSGKGADRAAGGIESSAGDLRARLVRRCLNQNKKTVNRLFLRLTKAWKTIGVGLVSLTYGRGGKR